MAVTYTTATIVKKTVENIDASLLDADIEVFISEAESILDATMGRSFISTFDTTKHYILRAAANKWAGLCSLAFNPAGFTSTSESAQIADILWEQWQHLLENLGKTETVKYLESL